MPKKILHIITSLETGGAQKVLSKLVESDEHNEHVIAVLKQSSDELKLDCQVHTLNFSSLNNAWMSLNWLLFELRNEKYSLMLSWLYHADFIGSLVALLTKAPLIWNIRHTYIDRRSLKLTTWLLVRLNFIILGFVPQAVIYCASSAKNSHKKLTFWKKPELQINNGVFIPHSQKLVRSHLTHCKFIWVGRDDPQKGFENFLNAIASLKKKVDIPFQCNCYGDGIDTTNEHISQMINKLNLHDCVNLMGRSSHIYVEFGSSHFHVLSSWSEGFPNVVVEAMSNSVPSIVTDVGDAAAIVGDTGWIVSPDDEIELSEAMRDACIELMNDNNLYSKRRLSCFNRAIDNYSLTSMLSEYQKVFDFYGR